MLVGSAEKEGGEREARENEEEKKRLHREVARAQVEVGRITHARTQIVGYWKFHLFLGLGLYARVPFVIGVYLIGTVAS